MYYKYHVLSMCYIKTKYLIILLYFILTSVYISAL